eukprot:GHVN01061717.1.p1 GENE.GHVN01061717.1~~GHVN01061717.1.p1  ORF type:complete len:115 (-),score=34.22 GHVN01061717.1:805-1149(-)
MTEVSEVREVIEEVRVGGNRTPQTESEHSLIKPIISSHPIIYISKHSPNNPSYLMHVSPHSNHITRCPHLTQLNRITSYHPTTDLNGSPQRYPGRRMGVRIHLTHLTHRIDLTP